MTNMFPFLVGVGFGIIIGPAVWLGCFTGISAILDKVS